MSELINKKELKKESREFRTISSRTLTSDFQMFDNNLKRLMNYIDNNSTIKLYIDSCISEDDNFSIEDDVNKVCNSYGFIFESLIDEKKEVSYIYQILKYIVNNDKNCRGYIMFYSPSNKYQDKLKGFCDNVLEPFINYIDENYERIFIEMGYDEDSKYEITINGGQVNIAKDNAFINANQNNYSEIDKLVADIRQNIDKIEDEEIKQDIIDNVEGIQEELRKKDVKKGRIKSFISSLQIILPKIGNIIEVSAAVTELITFVHSIGL